LAGDGFDTRRRTRRHYRRVAALTVTGVLLAAGLVVGLGLRGGGGVATVEQPVPSVTNPGPTPTRPPVTTTPTTLPSSSTTTAKAAPAVVLRPDGLGVADFGAAEREALGRLRRELGPPGETRSWNGVTPFGTCPGDTRAVRWGRLYVLFTNGPTRYASGGTWHLFAYQVEATQRSKLDPQYSGPTPPPEPPPLRGDSPKTAVGIGFGATLAELRAAYGDRLRVSSGLPGPVHRFQVRLDAGELSGSLDGRTPSATITGLAAGAVCGE
jgi:hypothetical protein